MLAAVEKSIITEIDLCGKVYASELAIQLELSEKTIYRKIKIINRFFENEYGSKIILSSGTKGFEINDEFSKLELSKILNVDTLSLSTIELVSIYLVECSPKLISISKLFDKYFLSDSSINRMLKQIQMEFNLYNIELIRTANQVKVVGLEPDIRRFLNNTYIGMISKNSFLSFSNEQLGFNKHREIIENVIRTIEDEFSTSISEPYYTNLYIYIHILLRRYQVGVVNYENKYISYSKGIKCDDQQLRGLSSYILKRLEEKMRLAFKGEEISNLYVLILSSRMDNVDLIVRERQIKEITKAYIMLFFEIDKWEENAYLALTTNLELHIGPMLFRNENKVEVINHLTTEIEMTYKHNFHKLLDISSVIANRFEMNQVSKDEVAYITLYFEEYLLMSREKVKVMIACSSGIGTSKLLKIKLEQLRHDIEIVGIVNTSQLALVSQSDNEVDLIISTTNIEKLKIDIPVIYVNPLLSEDDVSNIRAVVKEVKNGKFN